MLRISQVKLPVGHSQEELYKAIIKKAGGKKPQSWKIIKRSIDARKKPDLYYIYTVDAGFSDEKRILARKRSGLTRAEDVRYYFPYTSAGKHLSLERRPVIVGAGPAGLFAGLVLSRAGYKPVIFERGDPVEVRKQQVQNFWTYNDLDPESNVQFGEGGAGTFSDGKLNTLVKDKLGRNHFVLEEFVRHGAPEEILYEAKPHIGTDILMRVVASIREEIKERGGQIHFRTKVVGVCLSGGRAEQRCPSGIPGEDLMNLVSHNQKEKRIIGLHLLKDGKEEEWPCENVILAIGHSARDTFYMLRESGVPMSAKSFAIGVRVEHPAEMINESQYGIGRPDRLPAASYKLTHQCSSGRGVYSFCMCPGGYVVNSSSEPGLLCVNGMSYHGRDGKNSNSAIITTVTPEDFPGTDALAGIEFQRKWERLAYEAGAGSIPVQLLADFRMNQTSAGFGAYTPATMGKWKLANLRECLPDYVSLSLMEGMESFGRRIAGYDREDTILLGVETRTSSPIRIERDKEYQSRIRGLFPCGEGAGYAGGITSAAMDGLKVAEAVANRTG